MGAGPVGISAAYPLAGHQARISVSSQLTPEGGMAEIVTHCNERFMVCNSRNSRAARRLRDKWCLTVCPSRKIPDWRLEKYSTTGLNRQYGSKLSFLHTKAFLQS